jgi:long-chain acyl-CoA synthetase
MGNVVWRDTGGVGTLRSVVDGLSAFGGRPALVAFGEERVEIWSYGELAARVGRLARGLRGVGVERGDHVAILCANRPEWIAACLAVVLAGGVVVPLDVQIGDGALGRILADSGARHVFTTVEQAGRLEGTDEDGSMRLALLDVGEEDRRSWRCLPDGGDEDPPQVEPGDGAALFYTSGTTGAAKGYR